MYVAAPTLEDLVSLQVARDSGSPRQVESETLSHSPVVSVMTVAWQLLTYMQFALLFIHIGLVMYLFSIIPSGGGFTLSRGLITSSDWEWSITL